MKTRVEVRVKNVTLNYDEEKNRMRSSRQTFVYHTNKSIRKEERDFFRLERKETLQGSCGTTAGVHNDSRDLLAG